MNIVMVQIKFSARQLLKKVTFIFDYENVSQTIMAQHRIKYNIFTISYQKQKNLAQHTSFRHGRLACYFLSTIEYIERSRFQLMYIAKILGAATMCFVVWFRQHKLIKNKLLWSLNSKNIFMNYYKIPMAISNCRTSDG